MSLRNYGLITTLDELRERVDSIHGHIFGFDIESGYHGPDIEKGAIHPETAFIVGISFTDSLDWARYVPLGHDTGENLDNQPVAKLFWDLLATGLGVAHNAAFELRHMARWFREHLWDDPERGEAVRASNGYFKIYSDSMVEAYLAAEYPKFGLKYLTEQIFGHKMTELFELFPDLQKNKRKFLRFNVLETTPQVVDYACEDSVWCLAIHRRYYDKLKDTLLYKVEKAIVQDVVPHMEDEGVVYDWAMMRRTADELRAFRDKWNAEIMADLSQHTGEPVAINLASPPQVRKVLFEKMGLRTSVYTDKTRDLPPDQRLMSTGDIALTKLAKDWPIVKKILQWREMTKLLGTYLDKYESKFNYAGDGRAHPNHLSAFVITGRFAVSDPPYQGSPKKYHFDLAAAREAHVAGTEPPVGTCFKFNFRNVITCPPDHYILGFDLSQAELRAIAGEAGEQALLEAFTKGDDVHRLTASLMLGTPLAKITPEQRDVGKAQPIDEVVLTPMGWREIGSLKVGDLVIAQDGAPTEVTGVFPQGRRQVYRVSTSDGGNVRASDEHWWVVEPVGQHPKLMTTEELAKAELRNRSGQLRYYLPNVQPPQLSGSYLDLDPYLLGLLIGDGSMTTPTPYFCSTDQELFDAAAAALPAECMLSPIATKPGRCPAARIVHRPGRKNTVMLFLRRYGLAGKTAHHKFVPSQYLTSTPDSRLAILQGLLDTDGSPFGTRGFEFSSASLQLAQDVQQLTWSLGGRARIAPTTAKTAWRVWGRLPAGVAPFRLQRKLRKIKLDGLGIRRTIVSVEALGFEDCVCISVAHPERLYVTKDYLVTHNTMNFALLYGMSTKGLADRLGIPIDEAQALMDKYFAGLPAIAAYMARQVQHGKTYGYVTSHFGRRLPIWEYESDNPYIYSKGDRACVNYPIQGAATGDYMKIAMVRLVTAITRAGLSDKIKLVMNIHDALELYVHRSIAPQQAIDLLKEAVIFPVKGWPAMRADWHIAKRWGSPTELTFGPDGELMVNGEPLDRDPVTQIEETEDGAVEVLPDVSLEALRAAAGRTLVITLSQMPTVENWYAFEAMARDKVGVNQIRIETPEGARMLPFRTGLTTYDLGGVAQLLPVASMTEERPVVSADLVSGLTL